MTLILDMATGACEPSNERTAASDPTAQVPAPFTPSRLQLAVREIPIASDSGQGVAHASHRQRLLADIKGTG
jgi:hypothetical protein